MRQPAELAPAAGEATASDGDARLLGGHDVHDHAGGVDGAAAGDVEPDPVDRHPPLGDGAARHDLGGDVGAPLVAVDQPGAADRLLQRRRAPSGRSSASAPAIACGGHPGRLQLDAVEPGGQLPYGCRPAMADVLADGPHLLQGGLDVELGAGQHVTQVRRKGTAQVDTGNHPTRRRRGPRNGRTCC